MIRSQIVYESDWYLTTGRAKLNVTFPPPRTEFHPIITGTKIYRT
jgi:hypothetical protein